MKYLRSDALSLRGWWKLRPADAALRSALRATIGANAVLVVVVLLGHPELGAAAAFGGMTAVHARFEPFAVRGRLLAGVALGMVVSVGAGVAASAAGWGTVPIVVLVAALAALAKLLTDAVGSGPPGGLMFVFAVSTMAMFPVTWSEVGWHLLSVAAGGAVAWLVGMSGRLVDQLGPVRLLVARALDAVATSRVTGDPHPAIAAIDAAWRAVNTVPARREVSGLEAALVDADLVLHDSSRAVAPLRERARELRAIRGIPVTAEGRRRRALLLHGGPVPGSRRSPGTLPAWGRMLRSAVRPSSAVFVGTVRVGLGVLAAGLLAAGFGFGHAYWAMVAAAAVLQTTNVRHTVHRTVQRAVGTVAGAVLGAALLLAQPSQPVVLTCVVIALLGAEFYVVRNYAAAMVFVTPLTLLLASIPAPADAAGLVADRVLDTVLGAFVGFLAAVVVPGRHRHATAVRRALESLEAANAELRRGLEAGDRPGSRRRALRCRRAAAGP